jgi:short-subunit dehydrogenase
MRANQDRFGWPDGGSALPRPAGWTGQRRHRAALPHLLQAAEEGPRRVADIVNISSIAGRVASNDFGVYSFTKFGVRGFTESLRQEGHPAARARRFLEPGGVATELGSHNKPEVVTRPRYAAIGELWIMPTEQL